MQWHLTRGCRKWFFLPITKFKYKLCMNFAQCHVYGAIHAVGGVRKNGASQNVNKFTFHINNNV